MRSLQESVALKKVWRLDAESRIPVGTRVRVVSSDALDYVGKTGLVHGYDVGGRGDYPGVVVAFDDGTGRDLFYCDGYADDEIVEVGLA